MLSLLVAFVVLLGQAPAPLVQPRVEVSAKRLLTPADFTYLGSYDLTAVPNGAQGLTHRYVNGDLRFLSHAGSLREFSLAGKAFGATITTVTRTWSNIEGFSVASDYRGIWWDEAKQRLWTTAATSVTSTYVPTQIYTRRLEDDGTISQLRGPVSLEGITAKRVFGGATAIPSWFQQQYGVGPYAVGWGGGTSLIMQGGNASIGPTFYALPDPDGFASGTTIPVGTFRTLMDYAPGDTFRSTRVTLPINYLDGGNPGGANPSTPPTGPPLPGARWQSPRADGLGWWTPCDSYWNTGTWIDTPTTTGFVAVFSGFGGRAYYMASDVYADRMEFELHIFDPATLGQVAQGQRAPFTVAPAHHVALTLPGLSNQGTKSHMTPGKAVGGATFDPIGRRLYVLGLGINNFSTVNRLYVFDVRS